MRRMSDRTSGADALAGKLQEMGITRFRLERQLGLSNGCVQRWISGQRLPDVTSAVLLELKLGIPVASWADQERLSRAA